MENRFGQKLGFWTSQWEDHHAVAGEGDEEDDLEETTSWRQYMWSYITGGYYVEGASLGARKVTGKNTEFMIIFILNLILY